ncbi:MAG: serine/threonine-protein kinase [Thermoanaerobaculia bacterium]
MSAEQPKEVTVTRSFVLLRPLGQGTMGEVFEAVEPGLGQTAAVKLLRPELADSEEVRARFEAEAQIMATIDHPGNLPVYGFGIAAGGRPFYAMKKVAGRTLEALLAERGERVADLAGMERLLGVFESVCETVANAHERGVVHRDLKPANILVDDEHGAVFVIDWGLAKRVWVTGADPGVSRTFDGAVMGTPGYLSPEQARGDSAAAGPQADVFGLGVILYEILTGTRPFAGASIRESLLRAVHRQPRDPRRLNFWVSRSLAAVCRRALDKDPNRRYPTARQLAADVRSYRRHRRVSVVRPSPAERLSGWSRRRPNRAAVVFAASAALVTLAAFVGIQVWIDRELADKALVSIDRIDGEIAEIDARIAGLDHLPSGDRRGAGSRRRELSALRLYRQFQALTLLTNVAQLRFIRADPEVQVLGRERMFAVLRSTLDGGQPELVKAMAETTLERAASGVALLRWSALDLRALEAIVAEADAELAAEGPPRP